MIFLQRLIALGIVMQVQLIPKRSQKETILTTVDPSGRNVHITVPKGVNVAVNISAIHYNRKNKSHSTSYAGSKFMRDNHS